jgi:hypothetical protein
VSAAKDAMAFSGAVGTDTIIMPLYCNNVYVSGAIIVPCA